MSQNELLHHILPPKFAKMIHYFKKKPLHLSIREAYGLEWSPFGNAENQWNRHSSSYTNHPTNPHTREEEQTTTATMRGVGLPLRHGMEYSGSCSIPSTVRSQYKFLSNVTKYHSEFRVLSNLNIQIQDKML